MSGTRNLTGPMLVRSSRFVIDVLATALIGLVLLSGLAVWKLSRGPISLSFLTPYVEDALNPGDSPVRVQLADTVLTWAGLDRTLDVRAIGLDVVGDDGAVLASVPEISVRFSTRALLSGLVAPTSLELLGPRVKIVREADGSIALNMANERGADALPDADVARFVDELIARPDRTRELGYLRQIGISSALVEYEDRQTGMRLVAPRVNLALERDAEGIRASGSVAVDIDGRPVRFQVSGILSARSGSSDLGLTFLDVKPSTLAPLAPELAFLADIDIPLSGTVALALNPDFELDDVGFDIDSAGGDFALPALYAAPHRITGIELRGRARDAFRSITLDEGRFEIGGVPVSISGTLVRRGRRMITDFDARIRKVAVNDVGLWWPQGIARGARTWVTQNLRDGTVESARINISGSAPLDDPAAFEVVDIDGRIDATGVTVHYLRPMEPVRGVNAVGTFDLAGFVFDTTAGNVRQINVESGRITIAGLDGGPQGERINIDLTIAGSVRGALELLDQEPLELVRRIDVDPAQVRGRHRTQLIVQFPPLDDLRFDDIRIAAASSLSGFEAARGPFGLPISGGELSLQVDTEKMIVDGNLAISGVPAGVAWTEWFTDARPTRRTYQVRAILNDAARAKLDLDLARWLTGPVGIGLTWSEARAGFASGAVEIDLSSAAMTVDEIGWRKPAGITGRAFLRFSGGAGGIRRLDRFSIAAGDLVAEGEVALRPAAGGGVEPAQLTLKRLAFGDTDVFAAAEFAADGAVDVSLGGRRLDLRREVAAYGEARADSESDETRAKSFHIRVSQAAPLGTVRLGETTTLDGLWGTVRLHGAEVRQANLAGNLNGRGAISLAITETGEGRDVKFAAADGGDLVSALDVTDTILGGRLELKGKIADGMSPSRFVGQADLTDFHLTEASSIARALTLASFSGISDTIGGRGLAFRRAEVPMTFSRDEIVISDAKLRGSDIGVLAEGRIDRHTGTIDLRGEVAPAYTLNSLLGNIPLIGTLLTGGGDGIFAASYDITGPLDEPKVSVNPLTVLTPGIIRRLLTGFGSDNQVTTPGNGGVGPGVEQSPRQ